MDLNLDGPKTSNEKYPVLPEAKCLAKTRKSTAPADADTGISHKDQKGADIYTHLFAAAQVILRLREIYRGTPGEHILSAFPLWLAAMHDIGKATPVFQQKIYKNLEDGDVPDLGPDLSFIHEGHAVYSQCILLNEFGDVFGDYFGKLAGKHHGLASSSTRKHPEEIGGEAWHTLREHLIARLKRDLNLPDFKPSEFKAMKQYHRVWLGAAILADWISSGMDLVNGDVPDKAMIQKAVTQAGFHPLEIRRGLTFRDIYPDYEPTPLQKLCAETLKPGGIYCAESEMGSGKTEAALYLAYRLLESGQANGVYFALPTQLTSEKIHARLNSFLSKISASAETSSMLVHGDAWLDWELYIPSGDGSATVKAPDAWFQSKKRALLAPFGAGTVDQALLSVINTKFSELRAFALAGKVVIIDEVHSYDAYTGCLISELVSRLRECGSTVILLSATLTAHAKAEILSNQGRLESVKIPEENAYPLLTVMDHDGTVEPHPVTSTGDPAQVEIKYHIPQTQEELDGILSDAIDNAMEGRQVLWIENTVGAAQDSFRKLRSLNAQAGGGGNVEIGLLHSRFPGKVRAALEDNWVSWYGKDGIEKRREHGRILVSTQVVEQSVDIDADILYTRLAPSDMMLQRIGRLWRHRVIDAVRPHGSRRIAHIISDPRMDDTEKLNHASGEFLPYDAYYLLRAHRVWKDLETVCLPGDIRPILEETYAECEPTDHAIYQMQENVSTKKETQESIACMSMGTNTGAFTSDDAAEAATRYSEGTQYQVLLLRKNNGGYPLEEMLAPVCMDTPISIPPADAPVKDRKDATKAILPAMVKVQDYGKNTHVPDFEPQLGNAIKHLVWTGRDDDRPIRAAYVDLDGRLLHFDGNPYQNLCYNQEIGYIFEKPLRKEASCQI